MKTLFAVPWIEVEYDWGDRPEGYKVFDDLEMCIKDTNEKSENGNYSNGGGYFGPERPLGYYETPDEIEGPFPTWVDNLKFTSDFKCLK